jgi:glycosyltransferase involved in cell wall biosynthesis
MNGRGIEFIKNNITHILDQDYQDFEIIISDNSLDCELCESIKNIDSRIKYFKSIKFGSSGNTNFGISKASGELIKVIFQDDFLYTKDCLSELVKQATKTDKQWFMYHRVQTNSEEILTPHWNPYILHGFNTISAPSVVAFKKQNKVRFREQLVWYMDICFYYDMFMEFGEPELIKNAIIGISEWEGQVGKSITAEIYYREKDYIINTYGII